MVQWGGFAFANTNKAQTIPLVSLNNGIKMPILGYGTLKLGSQKETQKAVEEALEVGYRLFDTAQSYLNEEGVGYALKATGVKREELFITAKLFAANYKKVGDTKKTYKESCKKLGIEYADLFLIHQPIGDVYQAYREMQELYKDKEVRAIGVSNFYPARFMDLYLNFEIKPAVNQIECHPIFQQEKALELAKSLNVQLEAHSPLYQTRDNILKNSVLSNIAKKHKKNGGTGDFKMAHTKRHSSHTKDFKKRKNDRKSKHF